MRIANYTITGPGATWIRSEKPAPPLRSFSEEEIEDPEAISILILSDSEKRLKLETRHISYYKVLECANYILPDKQVHLNNIL